MSLIKEYFRLLQEYITKYGNKTILLMQVGAFYEVYGEIMNRERIDDFCRVCELACANKTQGTLMAGFRDYSLEKYVNRLQEAGYTIVQYSQNPNNKEERNLSCVYSPGTYFNSESAALSNCIACVCLEKLKNNIVIGMANIDVFTGRSTVFEIETEKKHAHTSYDEIERFISLHVPSEFIIIPYNFSQKEVDEILSFIGIESCVRLVHRLDSSVVAVQKAKKQVYQQETMKHFFGVKQDLMQISRYEYAAHALTYLLNFVHEHNPHLVDRISEPTFENCSDRMILANHSLKQLNIIEDDVIKGKLSSVCKFLNNCVTPMGSRHFRNRLLNPSCCACKIQIEYDITEHLLKANIMDDWRIKLATLKDLEKINRSIMMSKCFPQMLYGLYINLDTIHLLDSTMDKTVEHYFKKSYDNAYGKTTSKSVSEICLEFRKHMDTNFHMDRCENVGFDLGECDFVRSGINKELDTLQSQNIWASNMLAQIKRHMSDMISSEEKGGMGKDFIKIHETEKGGISLQTTKRRSQLLGNHIKNCIKKGVTAIKLDGSDLLLGDITYPTASGSSNEISSPQIDEICHVVIYSNQKIKEHVLKIYNEFISNMRNWNVDFQKLIHFTTMHDLLQNQCYIVTKFKLCKPVISLETTKSFFDARELRHCLIERLNEDETYVANDVALGSNDSNDGMLIYGTNAVGKTSLIRAVGICIIMAQAGLYVPCSSLTYYPYTTIFTRILGNDNLFKGMSTFQVEMSELRVILRMANNRSLILGDELCSGTEIDSAISIFVSGLNHLHSIGCTFMFATHLHEIQTYEEVRKLKRLCMKHLTVVYDKKSDRLVYGRKLANGSGASMYGLEVCKSLHLPDSFLEFANKIRLRYRSSPSDASVLSFEPSHFNAHKLKGICQKCSLEFAEEVHHLLPQKDADRTNYIGHVPKNHVANLMALCKKCHDQIHHSDELLLPC